MKLLTHLFVCLVILSVAFPLTAQENEQKFIEYTVTADTANLRAEPSTSAAKVGVVSKGESILIYDETSQTSGWLRVYREGEEDAYIADFLVERAPMRFYPVNQEPILVVSGRGKEVSDVYDIPLGIYRIDAEVEDRAFILKSIVVEGECRDNVVFNELNFNARRLSISGLFVSRGCSIVFETDNVDRNWSFELRDIIGDIDSLKSNSLVIENGTSITGTGRALTMSTYIDGGLWTVTAKVEDNAFILDPQSLNSDCDESSLLNEFESNANSLEISSVYRVPDEGCIVWWETSNVEGAWEITFEKLR